MIDDSVRHAIAEAVAGVGGDPGIVTVEPPRDDRHGDLSTNAAMLLARTLRAKPLDIAQRIVDRIATPTDVIEGVDVAPPGFINVRVAHAALAREVETILAAPDTYGCSDSCAGRRVQVEFVSANPTGPLNVVSARAAAVGDSLVRLLRACGADAKSEFYCNDAGNQVDLLAESFMFRVAERIGRVGADGLPAGIPAEGYHGAYMTDLVARLGDAEVAECAAAWMSGERDAIRARVVRASIHSQHADLRAFRVEYDEWFHETRLHAPGDAGRTALDDALAELAAHGHVFDADGARWLRTTTFGDDKDRVLVRADGRPTYFLADIAYHRDKHARAFGSVVDIWGPDHHGYVARMKAAMEALGYGAGWLDVLILQQVTLKRGGEIVKMSKRLGEFVTLGELVDEVGVDAARFFFLMRRSSSPLDFDLALAKESSDANPVYYVQYAHARIAQLEAHARERGAWAEATREDLALLTERETLALLRQLASFPRLVRGAAESREPHRVTAYLQDTAATYHAFYHNHRVVTDDVPRTRARLALSRATRCVLRRGLDLIGVTAPERMYDSGEGAKQ